MQGHRELLHRAGPSKNLQEQQVSQTQFSADRKDLLCFFFFLRTFLSTTKPLAIQWRGALMVVYSIRKEGSRMTMNQSHRSATFER